MSEKWTPKEGGRAHLTVEASYGDHAWHVIAGPGVTVWIPDDSPHVVRVEPAPVELPTGFGARIRATVGGVPGVRLTLVDNDASPWRTHPGDCGRCGELWVSAADLSDVVVLDQGEAS